MKTVQIIINENKADNFPVKKKMFFVALWRSELTHRKSHKSLKYITYLWPGSGFNMCFLLFSENDLEEILTRYTRVNNNASIFLGNSPSHSAVSRWQAYKPPLQRQNETKKHLRRYIIDTKAEKYQLVHTIRLPCPGPNKFETVRKMTPFHMGLLSIW